jgi:hypothetical protein
MGGSSYKIAADQVSGPVRHPVCSSFPPGDPRAATRMSFAGCAGSGGGDLPASVRVNPAPMSDARTPMRVWSSWTCVTDPQTRYGCQDIWGARLDLAEQPAPRGTDGIGHRRDIEANHLDLAPSVARRCR